MYSTVTVPLKYLILAGKEIDRVQMEYESCCNLVYYGLTLGHSLATSIK
jgi:hypothetical protein